MECSWYDPQDDLELQLQHLDFFSTYSLEVEGLILQLIKQHQYCKKINESPVKTMDSKNPKQNWLWCSHKINTFLLFWVQFQKTVGISSNCIKYYSPLLWIIGNYKLPFWTLIRQKIFWESGDWSKTWFSFICFLKISSKMAEWLHLHIFKF